MLGQAILVAATPLLTRIYSPSDFGLLALYMSIVMTLLPVISLRYEAAIPLPRDDDEAGNLFTLSVIVVSAASLLLGGISAVWGGAVVQLLRTPEFLPFLWLVPLGLFAAGIYQVFNAWALRRSAYQAIARTRVHQGIAQIALQLGLGLGGVGPLGLLLGDAAGRTSGIRTLYRAAVRTDRTILTAATRAGMRGIAIRYRDFPILSSPAAFLNTLALQLPLILLAALFSPAVAGLMILGQRVVGLPLRLIGHSVAQVYMSEAARAAREAPETLLPMYSRLAWRLVRLGAPAIAAICLAAPWAFPMMFGDEWRDAGLYVLLLAPMSAGQFVLSPLSQTPAILERQGVQLVADLIRVLLAALGITLPYVFGLSARWAVAGYSITMALSYIAYGVVYRRLLTHHCNTLKRAG